VTSTSIPDAAAAARVLAERTGFDRHDIAVVLGSGWRPAADVIGTASAEVPMAELPGFVAPTAVGHGGTARSVQVGDRRALVLLGRTHGYEGYGVAVGQPVLISDHLNLTAVSPLVGARFVDLTDLYSPRLRAIAREIDPSLAEGVYAGLPGPHFETPAEIRMLRTMGADLVGMSTVHEAIAIRAEKVEVFGLSLVTNLAAGITGEPLNHEEVLAAGQAAAQRMGTLLAQLVARA
jgi:purine-nucleoside phosphorylase